MSTFLDLSIKQLQFLTLSIPSPLLPASPRDESWRLILSLLYSTSWQKAEASLPSLAKDSRRRASVTVLSPGWRLCLRLLFHLRQRGTPSADAYHQLPSRLSFLFSRENSLTFRHMVCSLALAQPGSLSLESFHNLFSSLSITLVCPWGLRAGAIAESPTVCYICHHIGQ